MRRSVVVGALALALFPRPAAAEPDVDACLAAHEDGQIARKHDKLVAARQKFALCAVDACPKLARDDCAAWLAEIDAAIPTITVTVRDAAGAPVPQARCTLDGAPLDAALDPGAHTLHCSADGFRPVDIPFTAALGDRDRRIDATLEREPPPPPPIPTYVPTAVPPPPPAASPPSLVPVSLTAGLALASFATFAILGETGVSDEDNLRRTCKPACDPSSVDAIRTRYHVADAFLGLGVVATGVTAWLFFSRRAPARGDTRLGIQALPGGGGARVGVSF